MSDGVLWTLLAVLVAIPTWLATAPAGATKDVGRSLARYTTWGLAIGASYSAALWLASFYKPVASDLLWAPVAGGAAGALLGACYAVIQRRVGRAAGLR